MVIVKLKAFGASALDSLLAALEMRGCSLRAIGTQLVMEEGPKYTE